MFFFCVVWFRLLFLFAISNAVSLKNILCFLFSKARIKKSVSSLIQFQVVILDTESNPQSCYVVCKMARNRIAAVCELLTFLRHIAQNLYNSSQSIDLFLKLNDLQKLCAMTRLGFIWRLEYWIISNFQLVHLYILIATSSRSCFKCNFVA